MHSSSASPSVSKLQMGAFRCCSDPPQEVVSEPQQRQAGVCVNGKAEGVGQGCVGLVVFTVWKVKCFSLIKQNRNVPHFKTQSNITGPNNINVATYIKKRNMASIHGKASDILPVLLTLCYISAWKTAYFPGSRTRRLWQLNAGDYVRWFRARHFVFVTVFLLL